MFECICLAYIEGMASSRSSKNLTPSMDDQTTLSSLEDDERTYVSLSSEEGTVKCPIEYLILIFYGGMFRSIIVSAPNGQICFSCHFR